MKLRIVGAQMSYENPNSEPFALKIQFSFGVVTQPCTAEEFWRVINEILTDNVIEVETTFK